MTPEDQANCEAVYNFVLAGERHAVVVNGTECITLGHGLEEPVAQHAYFGTQRVIEDLKMMKGWAVGMVELFPELCGGKTMMRDQKTMMVSGFIAGVDGVVVSRQP